MIYVAYVRDVIDVTYVSDVIDVKYGDWDITVISYLFFHKITKGFGIGQADLYRRRPIGRYNDMADNYLEKKMEELRRMSGSRVGSAGSRAGSVGSLQSGAAHRMLSFPYKALRVLILSGARRNLRQYAEPFQRAGCRVAIICTGAEKDTDLGNDHGFRFHHVPSGNPAAAFADLVKAWRDIDVVIKLDDLTDIEELLLRHTDSIPYPNDWGMPVITVEEGAVYRSFKKTESPVPDRPGRAECRVLTFLSLKGNDAVRMIEVSSED